MQIAEFCLVNSSKQHLIRFRDTPLLFLAFSGTCGFICAFAQKTFDRFYDLEFSCFWNGKLWNEAFLLRLHEHEDQQARWQKTNHGSPCGNCASASGEPAQDGLSLA